MSKTASRKTSSNPSKASSSAHGAQSRLARLPFPRATLEDSLKIPTVIKEKNGGNPWTPDQVATAVGLARGSHEFYLLTAAARDFGLTIGTRDSEKIEIAQLGQEIVYAPSPEVEQAKKL